MMKAEPLLRGRQQLAENVFIEARVWRVPTPIRGSRHNLKYSLALVVGQQCVLRYDNEAGKGDHKHVGETETAYVFHSLDQLLADFREDVARWLKTSIP